MINMDKRSLDAHSRAKFPRTVATACHHCARADGRRLLPCPPASLPPPASGSRQICCAIVAYRLKLSDAERFHPLRAPMAAPTDETAACALWLRFMGVRLSLTAWASGMLS